MTPGPPMTPTAALSTSFAARTHCGSFRPAEYDDAVEALAVLIARYWDDHPDP
jgi:hypothetical protein